MLNHLKGALFEKKFLFNDFQICLFSAILITIWPFAPSGNFLTIGSLLYIIFLLV